MKGDLGKQLHLFRYVISYQQAKYIVDNYKGRTDEEKADKLYSQREIELAVQMNLQDFISFIPTPKIQLFIQMVTAMQWRSKL